MYYLFNNHFTFYLSYLGMNYSNVIGFLPFLLYLLQLFSGILLSCYHSSFSGFSAVYHIMIDVNCGRLIRFIHITGASIFMSFILFHWIRGTWIRLKLIEQIEYSLFFSYSKLNKYSKKKSKEINNQMKAVFNTVSFHWIPISGLLIRFFSLAVSFLGHCPCRGQMSYRGITVMINILTIIPLFGSYIGSYPWASSLPIINKIFLLHFMRGFMIALFIIIHITLLHLFSSFNLVSNNYSIAIPSYASFFKDLFISFVVFRSMSLLLFCEPDIFGSCDNPVFANPPSTPNHIVPEWYYPIYYCILRAFPNKTIGVIVVLFSILLVCFLFIYFLFF